MKRSTHLGLGFCLPALIILCLVAGWPLIKTFYFSLTDASLGDSQSPNFIGLENFVTLFQDPDWYLVIKNTLVFTIISVFFEIVLGVGLALFLNQAFWGRGILRTIVLVPWAIPTVVSAKMWAWMVHDLYGVLNELFLKLGLVDERVAWMAEPLTSMAVIIAVDVWKTTPFVTLVVLAALQVVPKSTIDASKMDGVGWSRSFFEVILPYIKPAIIVVLIFRTLDAMRVFDMVYVLTSNSVQSASMSVYARMHIVSFQDVGFGSAVSVGTFVIIMGFTAFLMLFSKRQLEVSY